MKQAELKKYQFENRGTSRLTAVSGFSDTPVFHSTEKIFEFQLNFPTEVAKNIG